MLIVGTISQLEDLDRTLSYAEDVLVTAIAVGTTSMGQGGLLPSAARPAWSLFDGNRVVTVGAYDVEFLATLPSATGQSLAARPGGNLVIGLAGAHLLTLSFEGVIGEVPAFDALEGRDTWANPAAPTPDLRSLAVSSADVWFANVHVGGVWRSGDQGLSWQNVIPAEADVHEVITGDAGCVAVAAAKGFGWSKDGGDTWQWTTEGLHAGYARAVALDGETAFLTASTGPDTSDGRLYRCRLGDALEQCAGGLPDSFPFNLDTGSVAAAGGQVALGTRDGRIFRSGDGGSTWQLAAERTRRVTVVRFS